MRADRPLILGVVCLASGVSLILSYCQGTTSMNAAFPFAGSAMHLEMTHQRAGCSGRNRADRSRPPAAVWAVIAAFVSQFRLLGGTDDRSDIYVDRDRNGHFEDEPYTGSLGISGHRHTG